MKIINRNEVMQNVIKNEIQVKTKYCFNIAVVNKAQNWNKIKWNRIK